MADRIMTAEARITARDATGSVFSQISRKMQGIESTAHQVNGRIGRVMTEVGARALAIAGPAAAVALGTKAYMQFADTERRVQRILITGDAPRARYAETMTAITTAAQESAMPIEDVTSGLENMVAAGMDFDEAMKRLPSVVRTAQAAGASTSDLAGTLVALNTNYGVSSESAQHFFDIIVKGGKMGSFEAKDLARYIPSIGASAVAAGLKGEEGFIKLNAALQVVRKNSGTSEEAFTGMSDFLGKMGSQQTVTNFKKLGVDLPREMARGAKAGKDVVDSFLDAIQLATKGDMSKLPQILTDKEARRAGLALMNNRDLLKQFIDQLHNVDGSTIKDLNAILEGTRARIDRLDNAWSKFVTQLGANISPTVSTVLEKVTERMDQMEDKSKPTAVDPNYPFAMTEGWAPNGSGPLGIGWGPTGGAKAKADQNERIRLMARVARADEEIRRKRKRNRELGIPDEPGTYERMKDDAEKALRDIDVDALNRTTFGRTSGRIPTAPAMPIPVGGFLTSGGALPAPGGLGLGVPMPPPRQGDLGGDLGTAVRSLEGAMRAGEVKAELEGKADVNVSVNVTLDPSIQAQIRQAVSASGHINVNGPGSVGTSSPDAAAPKHVGRGDM